MANKNMKRCLISLVTGATLFKTAMRYNYLPIRMAKIRDKRLQSSVGEDVEKLKHSYTANMNVK